MKHVIGLLVLSIGIGVSGVSLWVNQTNAAQPPKVYGLYDANNTYLGDVVGIDPGGGGSYTTYLPTVKGLLSFSFDGINHASFNPTNILGDIYYSGADCTGTAYVTENRNYRLGSPWIVAIPSNSLITNTVATSPATVSVNSHYTGPCENIGSTSLELYKLIPVTLPFDLQTIQAPFMLK